MKSGEAKLFAGILIAAIALSAIAIYPSLSRSARGTPPPISAPPKKVDITRAALAPSWSHLEGDPKAPYTLVEFGDYQCPTCAKAQAVVRSILQKYKGKLNLVVHHFQVNRSHVNSPTLSMAAEAASLQGKFWPMHDALYANQQKFESEGADILGQLTSLAGEQKLDMLRFRSDLTGDAARKAAEREGELANTLNVRQTPTFFFVPPKGKPTELMVPANQLKDWLAKPANWK